MFSAESDTHMAFFCKEDEESFVLLFGRYYAQGYVIATRLLQCYAMAILSLRYDLHGAVWTFWYLNRVYRVHWLTFLLNQCIF